ncbi:MAG: PQQ-dependent sugar dehydrogenase [Gammaproteobacteria bacterium]|nr:PQQ-dependent sugar dehydrogenase [Gammaproteobacteria bacterium]
MTIKPYALLLFWGLSANACHAAAAPFVYTEQILTAGDTRFTLRLPQGAKLELLTDQLDAPRLLSFAANGDLFIGSHSGKIYRLPPPYVAPEVLVTLDGYPHSVAFRAGEILIARTDGLYRAPYQPGQKNIAAKSVTLLARLPGGSGHSSRSVAVGPDGRVYLSLGIQGNCSDQYLADSYAFDDRRGGILVLREENGKAQWQTYGSGLRNPVGFAWHPQTAAMYASNNGPDHWGFELPPEYFSRITPGSFHGMPWFQFDGKNLQRDDCVSSRPPRPLTEVTPPAATFPARNAPMGVSFVPKGALNKVLEFDAIVALHGSWATLPSGGSSGDPASRRPPKLVAVRFKDGATLRVDDLVSGFQNAAGERSVRPVGVAIGPDGALYFTSDSGINGLFRLKWK